MHAAVSAKRDSIAELCRRFHVRRLEVFGSAARAEDFDPARSDADFLVQFEPDVRPTIAILLDVEEALQQALGRPVDLVERKAVEESPNYLRRRQILREAEPVYVAR
ncbi:MAG TPA: nucleotidyltransferase domain-containing protein [Acetobacteraceae bacterium]|nr:nucleotidyltransferase domain-containing protein [Acetobacteraceae bacterium]